MIRYRIAIEKPERSMQSEATRRGTVYPWQGGDVGHMIRMSAEGRLAGAGPVAS
jgi:hypothetical protein